MKDENTKEREEHIIELVSSFCDDELNEEYKDLCVNLVKKLGRKHDVPFKRGKLEIWASAVVYAIGQINFLFDKSFEPYKTPDDICSYFNTKKSTVSNKAHDIREMCDLGHFDEEFSTKDIEESMPTFSLDENGLMVPYNPMDEYFDEVYEVFEKGRIEEAISMLDDIEEDSPEYQRALFYKSFILNATGTKDESSEIFNEFISQFDGDVDLMDMLNDDVDENDPEELLLEGQFYHDIGDLERAVHYYDLSLKISPNQINVLHFKALALGQMEEHEEALAVIDKALKIDSNDAKLWTSKGIIYHQSGNFKKALKCLDKALKIDSEYEVAWENKGNIYFERSQYKNALKCYDKAIEIDPDEISYYISKAKVYVDLKDLENANKFFKKAEEIDSENPELYCEKGNCMMMQEKFEEAIDYYDRCLEIEDEYVEALLFKSMALAQLEREDEFEECMAKIMMINPLLLSEIEEAFR